MSSVRHELGGEHWIDLIDPDDLTSKHHRKILNHMSTTGNSISVMLSQRDAVLFYCATGWSFDAPLPTNAGAMDKLSLPFKPYRRMCRVLEQYVSDNLALNGDEDDDETPPEPSDS